LRALLAATGLLTLTSLSSGHLFAQALPAVPQAPATPEEAAASRNSSGNSEEKVQTNTFDMDKAESDLLGVPTAGAVVPEPKLPVDPEFPVPEDVEDAASSALKLNEQTSVLYDSKSFSFDKTGSRYNFSGDVVLIGAGYVITADDINVDYPNKLMTAKGHVLIIHQNQVFSGDQIKLHWDSSDFVIDNALLVASDPLKIREVSESILGLTPEELKYEAAKKARLEDLEKERDELRENFRKDPAPEPTPEALARYTRLLEQDLVTQGSLAPQLAQQDTERRQRFERRRIFWEKGREEAAKNTVASSVYFRLQGESLERKDGNNFTARDAIFTPCICADDESPAWGFQADEINAQQEGYIDLKHPILTIKGVPVIYLPYLKLPLKTKRQSGFLMPSFQSGQVKNGFVYSQPVFLDFGPSADATVTTDLFQKRGTRLGAEVRYESKSASGFRYQYETIRDRSFLETESYRRDLVDYFINTNPRCTQTDPIERESCEAGISDTLSPPSNTWRGKQEWAGRYSIAPRLSVVTKGKIVSDHRYLEDLYLPEEVVTAFAPKASANAFTTGKAKTNFDGKDFFVGLRTGYGDNSLLNKQYSGQQMPSAVDFQSRYFRIFPASFWKIPTYGELRLSTVRVDDRGLPETPSIVNDITLGSGTWNRVGLNLVTPISTDGIVKVDHFAEGEVRYVEHPNLDVKTSTVSSWKTGINLNLPIDGIGRLPDIFQPKDLEEGTRYGQHIMNWGLTFSTRPVVVRDGPYGDLKDENAAPLVYFPSDRNRLFTEDQDVRDEDIMVKHQRITLSTSHRWRFFDRVDQALPAVRDKVEEYDSELDNLQEQARRDLMSVKDRSVKSVEEIYRQDNTGRVDWLVRRYQSADQNNIEPIRFAAQISYDAEQERLRRRQVEENDRLESVAAVTPDAEAASAIRAEKVNYYNLYESWIGPSGSLGLNYKGFSLDSSAFYNLYKKTSTSLAFALGLPTFYSTQFGLRYVLEKSPELDPSTDTLLFKRTKTTTLGVATQLIPLVTVGANLIRKQVEDQDVQYGTSYQIGFDDRSGCWGLRFLREKDLNQLEEDANYIVQLAVIFLGNRRGVDVSPGLEREIRGQNAIDRN
jgi:lipopolysaccharide assembly outer membrane protein LptD (OstA)